METLDFGRVRTYVNENIDEFHSRRISKIRALKLGSLLSKNPYLFRAKNIETANELIEGLLDAFLSSSEEKMFGDFLEGLAIFVAQETCGGHKSSAQGVDLELIRDGIHHIISIKSGTNWGNSSQHKRLTQDLLAAVTRVRQMRGMAYSVQPVLGICYGKTRTSLTRDNILKVVGQNFWYLLSGDENLYAEIIEPVGYRAKEHNNVFFASRGEVVNRFTGEFVHRFCRPSGAIDWARLVEFNSRNLDLDEFFKPTK